MKLLTILIVTCIFNYTVSAMISDNIIHAIIKVESNGNNLAIGDDGRSVGCMQIQKSVIDDVNDVSSVKYKYNDRYNRSKSIEIFKIYITRYATVKRLGHIPTDEDIARIWNGGPNGYKKSATKKYWNKIKLLLHLPLRSSPS